MKRKKPANPIKDRETILDIQDFLKAKNERDYILFVLGISTGYRTGDLLKLKVRDIKQVINKGYFEILENKKMNNPKLNKKNMKPRTVKLVSKLEKILKNYIVGKQNFEYLFKSRKGTNKPVTVSHVSRILKEVGEYFGLDNITAHSMRKTYAYTIYKESNENIVIVKEMLGHSSIEMTKLYLGLDREMYDRYSDTLNSIIG